MTFEILDRSDIVDDRELRIVPASELHAAELIEQAETDNASTPRPDSEEIGTPQQPTPKSNVNTYDDPTNQKLTMAEIEALKQSTTGSGKELIEKIMQSHSTLDQKTAFSLAKYTLRKHKKYMKRFTVLPLNVTTLIDHMFANREFVRIMEMRIESLSLMGCWANIHSSGQDPALLTHLDPTLRYLVVDDVGGLLVAAMAERMGILHPTNFESEPAGSADEDAGELGEQPPANNNARKQPRQKDLPSPMSATSNTITQVHANQQPNLGLLRYFGFDTNQPMPSHPLYTHLKSVSWLQLLDPEADVTYQEPTVVSAEVLAKMKTNKRSTYFRKRKRWERVKSVVDETRAGGFNGLVIASFTNPTSILQHLVPLLAGGAQVVVYSPHVEPLAELADQYSTARRVAYINTPPEERTVPSPDFAVDPTLLLPPVVQTARVRKWQVLPGRTHPLMTGRGGAEGYIFVGTRVIPAEGNVEARGSGRRGKKAKGERNNEMEAQRAADREFLEDIDRQQEGEESRLLQSPLKKQKVELPEVVEQPDEDVDMPVLGPATEAVKQENGLATQDDHIDS